MKRRLSGILRALSLLLCLATGAAWGWGYWHDYGYGTHNYVEAFPAKVAISLRRAAAVITLRRYSASEDTVRKAGWAPVPGEAVYVARDWSFGYRRDEALLDPFEDPPRPVMVEQSLQVPYWLPFLLTGLWPLIHACRTYRDRRRLQTGLCCTCGYDLRASKDRCPECGTPIPAQTANSGGNT